jgi:hypothetical protein
MDFESTIKKYYKDTGNICLKININNLYVYNNLDKGTISLVEDNIEKLVFTPIYIGTYDEIKKLWFWGFNNITINKLYIKIKDKLKTCLDELIKKNIYNKKDIEKYIFYVENDGFNIEINNRDLENLINFVLFVFNSKGYIGQVFSNKVNYYIVEYVLVDNTE